MASRPLHVEYLNYVTGIGNGVRAPDFRAFIEGDPCCNKFTYSFAILIIVCRREVQY